MVEGIECLDAQLKIPALIARENPEVLRELHIGVVEARAVEEIALYIAVGSIRFV